MERKKAVIFFIVFFGFFLVGGFIISFFKTNNTFLKDLFSDKTYWINKRNLSWENFKLKNDIKLQDSAHLECSIYYEYRFSNYGLYTKIYTRYFPKKSWTTNTNDSIALRWLQLKYDFTELYTRFIKMELDETTINRSFDKDSLSIFINNRYDILISDLQQAYIDKQEDSANRNLLLWERHTDSMLNVYGKYSDLVLQKYYSNNYNNENSNFTYSNDNNETLRDSIELSPLGDTLIKGKIDEDDQREGEWKYYYINHKIKEIRHYKRGISYGTYIEYYENGNEKAKGKYIRNKEDYWTFYYPNGNVESEGFYSTGNKNGTWKYWDEKGKGFRSIDYKDGVINY